MRRAAIASVVGVISAGVVLMGGLGGESLARVRRDVAVNWRPAYDLIVLPRGAAEATSVDLNGRRLRQANFMSSLQGGISASQWNKIKSVPGVEIAAPIAVVGLMRRQYPTVNFPGLEAGFYEIERTVHWENGFESRLQGTASTRFRVQFPGEVHNRHTGQLALSDTQVSGFKSDDPQFVAESPATWDMLGLDPGGTFLVYGIDPVEEDRLVGLEAETKGRYLDPRIGMSKVYSFFLSPRKSYPVYGFPLIANTDGWSKSDLTFGFSRYDVPALPIGELAKRATPCKPLPDPYYGPYCVAQEIREMFAQASLKSVFETEMPFNPSNGFGGEIRFERGKWHTISRSSPQADLPYLARPSGVKYEVLSSHPEGPWLGAVEAIPTGSYGPEPTFRRRIEPRRSPYMEYQLQGRFDGTAIAQAFDDEENWLPEDTYRPPLAVRRFDDNGVAVERKLLRPTANPLGYLLEPPQALTTLKAARQLLGDNSISVIRVRVEGVDEAGEEAWTRIEDVARRIEQSTGLETVVTLGSSPARMLVRVPGIAKEDQGPKESWRTPYGTFQPSHDAEGFGWVEEPWLTEGAAISYLRAGAVQHLWLVIVLTSASLVYLIAAFTSLALTEVRATAIRRAVGWPRRLVFRHQMTRAALLGISGGVAGLAAGLTAALLAGLPVNFVLAAFGLVLGVVVCCLAALIPAWRAGALPLAGLLSGGEVAMISSRSRRGNSEAQRIFSLAVAELTRLKTRVLLALSAGVIATGSLIVLVGVGTSFGGSLQVTILGQAILLQTGPLQIAVTVVAGVLAVGLLGEILWQTVIDRRTEIGLLRAIGWRRTQVARLLVWQGVLLGGSCAMLGVLVAGGLTAAVFGLRDTASLLATGAVGAVLGGCVLGMLASGLPAYRASKESPAGTMRSL